MKSETSWRGLYAITDPGPLASRNLFTTVRAALEGGARLIQYRDKGSDPARRLREASGLVQLCRGFQVPLIVNDDIRLAAESGAGGVHLGRDDPDIRYARKTLGRSSIVGISCYNQLSRAITAREAGADYVAFGRFFPSSTKPEAVSANVALLRAAKREVRLPLVAIGGITPENGDALIRAGADMLAVIHGVFGQPDIRAAARAFSNLF